MTNVIPFAPKEKKTSDKDLFLALWEKMPIGEDLVNKLLKRIPLYYIQDYLDSKK